jgi:hypothetical protein
MSNKIDINSFMQLGNIVTEHGLKAKVLPQLEQVEIYDEYGNSVRKRFSELLYGEEGCVLCIRNIAERFEKLKFSSMRGAKAMDAALV